jgi:hypothetical protein
MVPKPPPYKLMSKPAIRTKSPTLSRCWRTRVGQQEVKNAARCEEDHVSRLAPDEGRIGGPYEAAAHVEQAEDADKTGGGHGRYLAVKEILDHGGRLLENTDARRHIERQHQPLEVECGVRMAVFTSTSCELIMAD